MWITSQPSRCWRASMTFPRCSASSREVELRKTLRICSIPSGNNSEFFNSTSLGEFGEVPEREARLAQRLVCPFPRPAAVLCVLFRTTLPKSRRLARVGGRNVAAQSCEPHLTQAWGQAPERSDTRTLEKAPGPRYTGCWGTVSVGQEVIISMVVRRRLGLFGRFRKCGLWDWCSSASETGLWGRLAAGPEADPAGCGAWSVDRGWGLGRDVGPALGIGGAVRVGGRASLGGLALVAAQVGELLDGTEEAAAEVSVVARQVNEGLGTLEHGRA